jgi:5-methyltetrahydropteroyltriglutamate--homocysteine methyltransferase
MLPTTVVGSYPQPDWLVDRELMRTYVVPRIRLRNMWRVGDPYLEEAQDDATLLAIRDMERAGIDIITDGEIRRESYSNRFATSLQGIDPEPTLRRDQAGVERLLPRIVGKISRSHPVEIRDMEFLRAHTDRLAKMTLPGPFTMSRQAQNDFYADMDEAVMDYAAAVNEEAHGLQRAGADVIQLDEPWVRNDPESAKRIAVPAINRALQGITVPTIVHLCFGYAAVVKTEKPSGYSFLPELAESIADQISIEAAQPRLDLGVLKDLAPKKVVLGVIDLADPGIESEAEVARRIEMALKVVSPDRLVPAPDCGMKYLPRATAFGKLEALANGAAMVRRGLE